MTPRQMLMQMQEDVAKLYAALQTVEGNSPNVQSLCITLVDVMADLDIAVNRAGRV